MPQISLSPLSNTRLDSAEQVTARDPRPKLRIVFLRAFPFFFFLLGFG